MHILKTAGKFIGLSLLGMLFLGVIIGFFYEKEIKQLVITELNKNIDTKIHTEEFDFSVISHFPQASFELNKVIIEEVTDEEKKDTLLYAKKLTLLFKLTDIFNKNISVNKIIVEDGNINIRIDKAGKGNYRFWKESNDSTGSGVIDLQKVFLKNVALKYIDRKSHQDYALLAKDAELSCRFAGDEFSLKTIADLFVEKLFVHDVNYADNKEVHLQSGLNVNTKTGLYKFDDSKIKIDGIKFYLAGSLFQENSKWKIDLAVKGDETNITKLVKILPSKFGKYPREYNAKGKILFSSIIKGSIEGKNTPMVKIDFTVKDGSIASGKAEVDDLNFSGFYITENNNRKSSIDVPALKASLSGHLIQASIRLDNLPDAFLTMHARTQINLKEIYPFIKSDTLESLTGDLAMNISYAGKVMELSGVSKGQLNKIHASGNIDISNVNFRLKNNPAVFKNLSGNFSLHDNDVYVKNFSGNISSSDFRLEGIFKNFISFLLIPDQPGEMQAKVYSKNVDLDELLENKAVSNSQDTSYILKFNPRLICELDVSIGKLQFRRFSATDIHGHVNLESQVISGKNLNFQAMGGNVTMDGKINASRRDSVRMEYDTKFTRVDITRLFYELENFDQHTMTDRNVKGVVSADVRFSSMWSNDLTLNSKSVRSSADVTVENGELINFAPIQALGKYIHSNDLSHIRFSTLKNRISIANRKISVPNMDINSSAINISGSGTHDFDNNIDYHLRLLLSDVLGKKVRNSETEFGVIEDDGLGRTKLFLAMKGTVDDPHFSYDRKAAGEKIRNDIANEKQEIKGLLKRELGLFKNEPSVQAPKPKKREEMQIDWDE